MSLQTGTAFVVVDEDEEDGVATGTATVTRICLR